MRVCQPSNNFVHEVRPIHQVEQHGIRPSPLNNLVPWSESGKRALHTNIEDAVEDLARPRLHLLRSFFIGGYRWRLNLQEVFLGLHLVDVAVPDYTIARVGHCSLFNDLDTEASPANGF